MDKTLLQRMENFRKQLKVSDKTPGSLIYAQSQKELEDNQKNVKQALSKRDKKSVSIRGMI